MPTHRYNENYAAYRPDQLDLVKVYTDVILTSTYGGRHGTLVLFRDRASGRLFLFVVTHLVHQKEAGAARADQAAQLDKAARKIAAEHGGIPIIYAGDFNRSAPLPVLGTRATGAAGATYTTYNKPTRSTSPDDQLDHLYGHGVTFTDHALHGLKGNTFTQPRAADHLFVTATANA